MFSVKIVFFRHRRRFSLMNPLKKNTHTHTFLLGGSAMKTSLRACFDRSRGSDLLVYYRYRYVRIYVCTGTERTVSARNMINRLSSPRACRTIILFYFIFFFRKLTSTAATRCTGNFTRGRRAYQLYPPSRSTRMVRIFTDTLARISLVIRRSVVLRRVVRCTPRKVSRAQQITYAYV